MFLRNLWYFACAGTALKPGAMMHKVLLDEPVLIGRGHDGGVFAVRDICPHRGMLLSAGRMVAPNGSGSSEVECPYHGWRFNGDGLCTLIPSLVDGQDIDPSRIKITSYQARESQGNIWIRLDGARGEPSLDAPPLVPEFAEDARPRFQISMPFHCDVDHAVVGLMDPAHGPFVHRAWWWRTEASMHEKAKAFAPSPRGFTMSSHTPSKNSFMYRILGGEISTEISFQLPGIRIEHIKAGRHTVVGLTTVTPLTDHETEVTQTFYWDVPWLSIAKPALSPFARAFLKQDRDMVDLQQEGLKYEPRLMLIDDADMQAKWYYRLKKRWADAVETGEPFENPVKDEVVLRWRS